MTAKASSPQLGRALFSYCVLLRGPFCLLIGLLLLSVLSGCESEITKYYDKNWQEVDGPEGAEYRRVIYPPEEHTAYYKIEDFYMDGMQQFSGHFSDLVRESKEGICVWYYKDGTNSHSMQYTNNQANGALKAWDESGKLILDGLCKNDELDGVVTFYNPNGKKSAVSEFKAGEIKPNGIHETYYEDGTLMHEYLTYQSPSEFTDSYYWPNGNIMAANKVADDELLAQTLYWENGEIAHFSDLQKETFQMTYPNGSFLFTAEKFNPAWLFLSLENDFDANKDHKFLLKSEDGSVLLDMLTVDGVRKRKVNMVEPRKDQFGMTTLLYINTLNDFTTAILHIDSTEKAIQLHNEAVMETLLANEPR